MMTEGQLVQGKDLRAWLIHDGAVVSDGSPLSVLSQEGDGGVAPEMSEDMAAIVRCVACPAVTFGLRLSSATGTVTYWFYRDEGPGQAIAGHFVDADGGHMFHWTTEDALRKELSERLLLDDDLPDPLVRVGLSRHGYGTLIGVIDLWRQRALASLLTRQPAVRTPFAVEDVVDSTMKTLDAGDARWLAAMVEPVSPFTFDITFEDCSRGLGELVAGELLSKNTEGLFEFGPVLGNLCAAISAPLVTGTVFARISEAEQTERREQLTFFRGMGRFCVAEFAGLGTPATSIVFKDSSSVGLDLQLSKWFDSWARTTRPGGKPIGANEQQAGTLRSKKNTAAQE